MRARFALSWFGAASLALACNAVLGMEELTERRGDGDDAGASGTSGGGQGGSGGMRGGSAGSTSGTAGESGAGMGGGSGDCTPDETARCSAVDSSLLGNCARGTVTCEANGSWGPCSVMPQAEDNCNVEGDDADCDGTPNGGCPCIDGDTRPCGPDTEDGICRRGMQECENETWGTCVGAVFPEMRDCTSSADNDCDGEPDDVRDEECPCATGGTHVCVEDAPEGWDGPMALATAAAAATSPSCSGTGYDRQVLTLFGAIDMGQATCGCMCGTPASMSCGAIDMHRAGTAQNCAVIGISIGDTVEYPNMSPSTCTSVPTTGRYKPMSPQFSAGACTPQPSGGVTEARFTQRMTACETNDASPAGCSSAARCMPELTNPLDAFCIYRDGDEACPSGAYTERTVYYETIDDVRTCSACTCGTATGSCSGRMAFTRTGSCPGTTAVAFADYGSCVDVDSGGIAIQATPSAPVPSGTCPPQGGSVQGDVTTAGAVTVCCKP